MLIEGTHYKWRLEHPSPAPKPSKACFDESTSGDINTTRLWWKHLSIAIAKMGHASLKLREAQNGSSGGAKHHHQQQQYKIGSESIITTCHNLSLSLRLYLSPSLPNYLYIYLSMFTSYAAIARRAFPISLFLFHSISLSISFSLSLSRCLANYLTILRSVYPSIYLSIYLSLNTNKLEGGAAVMCKKLAEMGGRRGCRQLPGAAKNRQKWGEGRGSREIARAARKLQK
jgi:hypothetical protein